MYDLMSARASVHDARHVRTYIYENTEMRRTTVLDVELLYTTVELFLIFFDIIFSLLSLPS
jgi:hypothetical protein